MCISVISNSSHWIVTVNGRTIFMCTQKQLLPDFVLFSCKWAEKIILLITITLLAFTSWYYVDN